MHCTNLVLTIYINIHVRWIFFSCFLKLITNRTKLVICLTCYVDIITSTKGYKNNTFEPLTKKLNKHVYSLQKQCSFHIFLTGTGTDPCFRYRNSQKWQQSSQQPSHILGLMPGLKARKSFHGVLLCLVMMYHQTNLDCKSFCISEDLVEMIEYHKMIFLNDTLADDNASPY